jgi:hypothetical protein
MRSVRHGAVGCRIVLRRVGGQRAAHPHVGWQPQSEPVELGSSGALKRSVNSLSGRRGRFARKGRLKSGLLIGLGGEPRGP